MKFLVRVNVCIILSYICVCTNIDVIIIHVCTCVTAMYYVTLSNRFPLLILNNAHKLVITNSVIQQADKDRTS